MKNKYLLLSAFFALGMFSAHAQFTNTNFGGSSFPQGSNPFGSLTLSTTGDTLFGMTPYGGAYGLGNIFCVSSSGYDDLLDFDDENGAEPYGSLTLSVTGDTLYGMTSIGGGDDGNIFSIIEDGSNFTEIYGFSGTDGAFPYGSLTRSVTGDTLFGMTSGGGTSSYGNVFCITTTGSYTDLLDFNNSNGAYPNGSLTLVKNHLFGMTSQGGSNNLGVLFAINTNTFSHTTLFNFDGTNGSYPYGSITASVTGDTLFGMTSGQGVSSYGNIFTYVIGSGLTDLLDFSGTDGNNPNGDLTLSRGVLFGMTNTGGSHSDGNIFSINPDGTSFIDLYDFYGPNGAYPFGSITFSRNEHKFFGMTSQGGEDGGDGNDGVIFAYDPLTVDSFQVIGVTCANKYQGSAAAVIIGGNPPYTYSWNPGGSTDDTITGLSAGSYTVTVTDNFGSTATSVAIVSGLSLIVTGVTNENCYGDSRGSITTNPSGGTAPYIYVWGTIISPYATLPNHGTSPTLGGSPTANMLSAGTYTITIKDACGDTAFAVATVTQPDSLAVSISPSHDTICAESPLALTSTTSGGTSPYTYSWFPGAGLSCTTCPNPTITPSTFTIDTLQVTDYNGCSATSAVSIGVISGIWTGIISTDWNDAGNWCGGVPTDTTNVVIPAGTPYSPATNTGTYAVCASLMISPGATLSNPQPLTVYGGITDSGTITAGNYIGLTGNWNNVGTFSANTYTVNFYGTSTQTINGATTFSTLDINNAAGVTDASAITVTTLTVGDTTSGSLLFDGGYQITSAGTFNLENSSMLKLGSSTATTLPAFTKDTISAATTVEYSSSSTQTVSGSPTYSNLILSGGSTKNLGGTTRVNAVLTLSSGSLALGSDTLTMGSGASISGASSSSYIQTNGVGTLRKLFNATGSFNYPVGDNVASTDYTPISLSVSSGSFPDYINVNTVNAKAPNNTSSSNYLNRYWKVTQNGSGTLNFNSIGTYLSGDVVGTSAHIFSVYSDTIWTQDSLINASSHTANVSGISINNSTATIVTGLEASASLLLSSGCTAAVKAIGEPPFTYAWSNGATTSSFSPAPPNTYSVVVTDGWGATGTISISNIHNFVILSVPILCFGYLGSVLSSSSGGSSPYTYSWSDGASQTTAQASGLSAGTYSVVVTDNIGCHLDVNWTLTQPNALEVTITNPVNLSCNGVCIGSATAVASGGGIGYIYSWAPDGQTTSTISALCAGTYTAYVHSIPDCGVVTATITISQPSSLGIAIESVSGILCNGGMGTATANIATGGTSPFTYSWSGGGGTDLTTTTLPAGTYTLTVTDNNHCYVSVSATITQPTVLGITMHSTTNVRCRYGTGTVTANMATGGTPAYVYSWTPNGGTGLTTTAISAGTYAIIVTDSHGCTASANVTLTQPLALSATATVTANNCNDGNEGSALVTPSGGTTPFIYSWSDANTQTTAAATGLSAGTYTATVTDDCSATTVAVVTISQPVIPLVVSIQSVYNVCGANTGTATATLNLSHTFSYEAAVQHWKVPTGVTTVTVAISGAGGGSEANETTGGGAGAMFLATCTVTPGDVLGVAIGQKGTTSTNGRGGGGGGATWVYDSSTTTLLAVAAGGGGSAYNANNGADGGTNLITNATISSSGGNSGTGGSGGSGGESGGSNSDNAGGGGAGWISNGQDDSKTADFAEGGNYQVNDFGKANSGAGTNSSNGYGGFGGGGQGGQEAGGGGGGYNGGGGGDNGAYGGGGGGSYLNGTVIGTATVTSTPNVNGSVTISYGPGGTSAYTYLWSNGQTSISATGLSAGSYTVTVTDHNGCMSQAITMISTYTAAASITVTQVSATTFSVTNVVSGAVYRWDYTDVWSDNYPLGYTYAGLGTVANLPVWPIAGTLTFWADSNSSCPTFTSVACTSTVSIAGTYTSTAYPRSSKRGMDIWAYDYPDILDGSPGNSNQDIENIVSYCSTNHITYVRIFDLMEDDSRQYSSYPYGIWVFGNRSTNIGLVNTYTPAYVTGLEYFISRLKAGTGEGGAGVEEVGVGYQTDDDFANLPPTTDQFTSVLAYNSGLNWDEKVDILTTDLEFWIDADYNSDFTNVHLPILKNMYSVSRYCNAACSGPNLRVEDYYSYQSTAITPRSEEDSIGKYSDRILYAEYTEGGPSNPTVNETDLGISSGDWYQSYDEFGKNPTGTYFKKEIWPEFSVENYTYTAVTYAQCQGNVGGTLDASGYDLWNNGEENHAEWIENYFFDNVVSYFGTKISGEFDYTLDTNFQILGNAWFFYNCMSQEQIGFSSTYLPYYVTVGPDYQWTLSSTPAVTFTATVNGGTSPFTYTWYNLDNGRVVFYSTSVNTCTVEFNPLANNYEVQRLGVVVKQSGITGPPEATYAIDYLCLYQQYNGGPHFLSPVHRQGNSDSSTITLVKNIRNALKIFPNPNQGQFTVELSVVSNSQPHIEIYSMMGQKIYSYPLLNTDGDNTINLNNEVNGVYFYRVLSESGSIIGEGKLIIEK